MFPENTLAAPEEVLQMKSVIVEMTMVLNTLMAMALQKNNKDNFCICDSVRFIDLYVH